MKHESKPKPDARKKQRDAALEKCKPHRWKPGQSGNPAGRPPLARCLTAGIRGVLDARASSLPFVRKFADALGMDPDACTVAEVLAAREIHLAFIGKSAAHFQEVIERTEGKVSDAPEQEANEDVAEKLRAFLRDAKERGGPSPEPPTPPLEQPHADQ